VDKFERYYRQQYIRALEKFVKSSTNSVKHDEVTLESFQKKIAALREGFDKVKRVELTSTYHKELQKFCQKIIDMSGIIEDMESLKAEILYGVNQLEKNRNQNKYKKEKHKKQDYDR
jgi:hypothetical protein